MYALHLDGKTGVWAREGVSLMWQVGGTFFNELGWGHSLDLGQCLRNWQFNLEPRMECKVIFLGLDLPSQVTAPELCWLSVWQQRGSPGANAADPWFLYDPGRNKLRRNFSGRKPGKFDSIWQTLTRAFPRHRRSGLTLTNSIHLIAGNQLGCWVSESLHETWVACSEPVGSLVRPSLKQLLLNYDMEQPHYPIIPFILPSSRNFMVLSYEGRQVWDLGLRFSCPSHFSRALDSVSISENVMHQVSPTVILREVSYFLNVP